MCKCISACVCGCACACACVPTWSQASLHGENSAAWWQQEGSADRGSELVQISGSNVLGKVIKTQRVFILRMCAQTERLDEMTIFTEFHTKK